MSLNGLAESTSQSLSDLGESSQVSDILDNDFFFFFGMLKSTLSIKNTKLTYVHGGDIEKRALLITLLIKLL